MLLSQLVHRYEVGSYFGVYDCREIELHATVSCRPQGALVCGAV